MPQAEKVLDSGSENEAARPKTPHVPTERAAGGFRLIHLIQCVFYSAIICWLFSIVKVPFVLALLFLVFGIVIAITLLVARSQSALQDGLLGTLAIAAERQMPLAPALEAYADLCRGGYRRKVRALAACLNRGMPLTEALDYEPGALPRDAEVLVRMGWESGMLAASFRQASSARSRLRPIWASITWRIGYPLFVLYLAEISTAWMLFFTMPTIAAICRDFGMSLPGATLRLIEASRWLASWYPWVAVVLLAQAVVFLYMPFSLIAWWHRRIPVLDRRHLALILRSLSWVVDGGMPLPEGVSQLAKHYPTAWFRTRLKRVSLDLAHGEDWIESFARHGLLRGSDAPVLESASRAGNLAWAMREVADNAERRLADRLHALVEWLYPLVVIALAWLVGLLAVAYFAPVVKLIELCTSWT